MFQKVVKDTRKRLQPDALLDKIATFTKFEDIQITILLAHSGKEAEEVKQALQDDIAKLPPYMFVYRSGPRLYVHIRLVPMWESS